MTKEGTDLRGDRRRRGGIMAAEDDRLSLALIMDQASYVFPAGEPGNLQSSSARDDAQLGDEPARQAAEHGSC